MTRSPRIVAFSVLAVVTLLGAGCASDDDETTTDEGEGSDDSGDLGEVTIGPDDPILIGSIQVQSGDEASLGLDQDVAIELAVEEKAELLGHEIELQAEDAECSADGGTTAAQRLVSEEQLVGVIGTSCSSSAVPAAPILTAEGIPLISGSNTAPNLTSDLEGTEGDAHEHGYLRVAHNDVHQGNAAAEYVYNELDVRTAATVHDGSPYAAGLVGAFKSSLEEVGGEVVFESAVDVGDTDIRPLLQEAAAEEPDLLFFPIFEPESNFVAQQAKEFPELAEADTLMAADASLSDTFVETEESEMMYFSGPATPEGPDYEDFVGRYEDQSGQPPIQAFHAHAYDSTNLLFAAIEAVAEEGDDGSLTIDRQALIDELYATEGFEGLTGTLACDEFGDCADPRINIVRNTDAEATINDVLANVLFTYEPPE